MEEYNEIFDILYDIKEKIPDNDYLRLNNLIMKMYDHVKNINDKNFSNIDSYYFGGLATNIYSDSDAEYDRYNINERNSYEDSSDDDLYFTVNTQIIRFGSIDIKSSENYDDNTIYLCQCDNIDVCTNNIITLTQCKNYNIFCRINPILRSLVDFDNPINLTVEPIRVLRRNYTYFYTNLVNLISLLENTCGNWNNTIIIICIYDFIMKNIEHLRGKHNYLNILSEKVDILMLNEYFMEKIAEFNFNPIIWKNTLLYWD